MNVTKDLSSRLKNVRRRTGAGPARPKELPIHKGAASNGNATFVEQPRIVMSLDSDTTQHEEQLQSWRQWVGHRVTIGGVKFGVLRYFGETQFASGQWCGVELDEPVGKNNGVINGVRYFTCEDKFGIFAPLAKTTKLSDDTHLAVPKKRPLNSKVPSPTFRRAKPPTSVTRSNADFGNNLLSDDVFNANEACNQTFCQQSLTNKPLFPPHNDNEMANFHLEDTIILPSDIVCSTPAVKKPSEDDCFNQTVTLNSFEEIVKKRERNDTVIVENLLDTSLPPPPPINNLGSKRDSTFILDKSNVDEFPNEHLDENFGSNDNLLAVDFNESLGILSPSEMKDFSAIFEGENDNRPSGILKDGSCDDVKDFPDFEVNTQQPTVINRENCTLNSFDPTFIESSNDKTLPDNFRNLIINPDSSAKDVSVFYKNDETVDRMNSNVPSELDQFCSKEFNSFMEIVESHKSDFEILGSNEFASIFGPTSSTDGSITHSSNKVIDSTKTSAPSNKLLKMAFNHQHKLNRLSENPEARISLAFINNETLPEFALNLSELDSSGARDSLSFLGKPSLTPQLTLLKNENLMNFSDDNSSSELGILSAEAGNQVDNEIVHDKSVKEVNEDCNANSEDEESRMNSVNKTKLINFSLDIEPESKPNTMPDLISRIPADSMLVNTSESIVPIESTDVKVEGSTRDNLKSSQDEKSDLLCCFADSPNFKVGSDNANQKVESVSQPCAQELSSDTTENSQAVKSNFEEQIFELPNVLTSTKADVLNNNKDPVQTILNKTVSLDKPATMVYNANNQAPESKKFRPPCSSSVFTSPITNDQLDDISIISGEGIHFEVSDVFESSHSFVSPTSHSNKLNMTYDVESTKEKSDICNSKYRRQTIGPKCTVPKPDKKVPASNAPKAPRKSIVSKVKTMIEASKKNQENVDIKNTTFILKKPGKWDAITSKINASLAESNASKVNIVQVPQGIRRHSTPKTSPGHSSTSEKALSKSETTAVRNLKNSLEMIDSKNEQDVLNNSNRDGKILSQLQNRDVPTNLDDTFKVPLCPKKKREQVLPSPSGSASTTNTASFSGAFKAKLTKPGSLKLPTASNVAKTSKPINSSLPAFKPSRISIGNRPKETPSKEAKSGRWSTGGSTPKTDVRKFVSKTELVREIQELGANCENRTKELNFLKIRLRQTTLAFEAFAILNKYMVEEYDPFSQPHLSARYEKAKVEHSKAEEQLQTYRIQLSQMQNVHSEEIKELTQKLGTVHDDELRELKSRHVEELAEVDIHHKQQVNKLRKTFKKEAEESEDRNFQLMKDLQDEHQKQKQSLQESHAKKINDINVQHEQIQCELQNKLEDLDKQYNTLQRQLKNAEEVFMKDKNSKIQYISTMKTQLEQEVESLKTVLDMKKCEIQNLYRENLEIKKELEELPAAKERIRLLETKTEDLKALMQEKVKYQMELSTENQQLVLDCEKETKEKNRLSMANEELQWRLQQSLEASARSTSLTCSPDLWAKEDDRRSASRMSLPILHSEKHRSVSPTIDDRPVSSREHSMSLSWHPALATHSEAPTAETSTPVRERPRSARDPRVYWPLHSKLSTIKAQKDAGTEILRRNSCGRVTGSPSTMSMSWGGETFEDFYEELDDSCIEICADQRSTGSRKFFIRYDCDKVSKGKNRTRGRSGPVADIDIDKSISGLVSMQSSFAENSSSYQLLNLPGSEASMSTSTSSASSKSQESNGYNPFGDGVTKAPMDFAGESMIMEIEPLSIGFMKSKNHSHQGDGSSTSHDDAKDTTTHAGSMATPSIESSSQGMADSTNLDVSWGDEEMLSENDS